jgi:hypothetical protein
MPGFGKSNPFPRKFGGGTRARTYETRALSRAFAKELTNAPALDPASPYAAEAYAYGNAIANVWAIDERLRGADIPARMLETLPTYEEILRTRPSADDSDNERRAAVAAKLRGISGQATSEDIEAVCRELLGSAFEGLRTVEEANQFSYWPGMNPGPPGFEWTSNIATIGIAVRRDARSEAAWNRTIARLRDLLHTLLPAWEIFEIGTDDGGFILGDGPECGIIGVTFL